MSIIGGTDKEDMVHAYSGTLNHQNKKDEIMAFAKIWMPLEITVLSELSQKEKDKYCMMSLIGRI